jgi:hypothetical protein
MSLWERRKAVAHFASLEYIVAANLRDCAEVPDVKAGARLVADRLAEIEPLFLEKADSCAEPWRQRWLNAAERWLEFYTSELRRLQDRERGQGCDANNAR